MKFNTIKSKIIIVLTPLAIIIGWLSINSVIDSKNNINKINQSITYIDMGLDITKIITETQKERGQAAIYIGDKDAPFNSYKKQQDAANAEYKIIKKLTSTPNLTKKIKQTLNQQKKFLMR